MDASRTARYADPMPIATRFLAIVAFVLTLGHPASAPAQAPVTVFAATSLQNALEDAGKVYTARTGKPVRFSFAASSAIARQIEQGAPANLFISADEAWMTYAANRKLIVSASRVDLLTNRLALVAPVQSKTRLVVAPNMPIAAALGRGGRLAIAGPEVPAGKYGRAALTSLGVWKSVESRLAQGENVRAALAFVARGEAPLGIVYDTDAKVEPRVRIVGLFPAGSHPRIIYPAALVAGPANPDAAPFLYWLRGAEAGAIFAKYGFARPKPN